LNIEQGTRNNEYRRLYKIRYSKFLVRYSIFTPPSVFSSKKIKNKQSDEI
jgi:hypothetical protein